MGFVIPCDSGLMTLTRLAVVKVGFVRSYLEIKTKKRRTSRGIAIGFLSFFIACSGNYFHLKFKGNGYNTP